MEGSFAGDRMAGAESGIGLVLDGMQVVSVKVAVALCADAAAAPVTWDR